MTLATYDFAYGNGRKTFQYDSDDVLKVVRTEPFEVMQNVHEHVLEALYHPIGLPPVNEIVKPGRLHLQRSDPHRQQRNLHADSRQRDE